MQRYGPYSFAQNGEDFMLMNLIELLAIPQARYLDLGAHHPETLSNTKLLYDNHFRGVNVEVNPVLLPEFQKQRPDDVNINIGIGVSPGVLPFYICHEELARSTFYKEMLTDRGFTVKCVLDLEVVPINEIIVRYCDKKWPEILITDLEGMDYEVLKSCKFHKNNQPKIIVTEVGFDPIDSSDMRNLLLDKGYFLFCRLACNMIFISNAEYDKVYS